MDSILVFNFCEQGKPCRYKVKFFPPAPRVTQQQVIWGHFDLVAEALLMIVRTACIPHAIKVQSKEELGSAS